MAPPRRARRARLYLLGWRLGEMGGPAFGEVTMKWADAACVALLFTLAPSAALAENYGGRIDLVSALSASPTSYRAFVRASSLSLYAEGRLADLLAQAFFRKAAVSVSYDVIPCSGGITGTCGRVRSVSADVTGIP